MKAMVFNEFGPPDVLHYEDRPVPDPGSDDLVMQVHAVSVNRVLDVEIRSGRAPHYGVTPPHIPGVDPSGVVVAVGDAAHRRVRLALGREGGVGSLGLHREIGDGVDRIGCQPVL